MKSSKMVEFAYEELEAATDHFSPSRLIGKGSHGRVYRGILNGGKLVAVKLQSLGLRKLQDNSKLENEARILSSLPQNSHLVNLVGTSHDRSKNKVLVIEHLPNGTLHDLLHAAETPPPPWPKRAQIALQVARAVQFLHQSQFFVIHRDIKSANILFDSNWTAKLADFGLAVRRDEAGRGVESLSRPAGTFGYLDPHYTTPCKLSPRNDVFSFGVVLLEIISGTKAIDVSRVSSSIVEWALPLIEENRIVQVCDKRVEMPWYMEGTIRRFLHIAARCVSPTEEHRRPSMAEIVAEMESCFVEPDRFPLWINVLSKFSLLKRQRTRLTEIKRKKSAAASSTSTSTLTCAGDGDRQSDAFSRRKMLLREVLADVTLE
ncbi:serine/threonine-protein kinase-like protein At5g23170 [Diospyros lotus]|uniref:serine/threonine-protein kinase-like protein At5g23170 n=1 Tax=Diospyros lotus TaxID=55363 RepID=UPI00224D9826|nr:serine/threonine-protein kinase-like protein At5g23170 [Diospyros lotus]